MCKTIPLIFCKYTCLSMSGNLYNTSNAQTIEDYKKLSEPGQADLAKKLHSLHLTSKDHILRLVTITMALRSAPETNTMPFG